MRRRRQSPMESGIIGDPMSLYVKLARYGPRERPIEPSLKGGDPAAGSPTATLLRLHPSR